MVASDKIQDAKDCFDQITKSGRNNYQHYDYFEVKDILPVVRQICKKYKLKTSIKPDLKEKMFILRITDQEDNSFEEFYAPLFMNESGDVGKQNQDYGRSQTYAQRYLYIQAFEIAVPDEIDNKDQKKTTQKKTTQKKTTQKKTTQKKETIEQEVTPADVQKALDKTSEIIQKRGQKITYATMIYTLGQLYPKRPYLREACKQQIASYIQEGVDGECKDEEKTQSQEK